MPLIKSATEEAVRKNTEELIRAGRDPKQAYAIAKETQREARKLSRPKHQRKKK